MNFDQCSKPVQSLSHVQLFATPGTAACQASLSFTISWILLKLMYIQPVMPSNHLILCHLLLLLPSIFPSIRVFPNESVLHIRWPKHWSFSLSISPASEYSRLDVCALQEECSVFQCMSAALPAAHRSYWNFFAGLTVAWWWPCRASSSPHKERRFARRWSRDITGFSNHCNLFLVRCQPA